MFCVSGVMHYLFVVSNLVPSPPRDLEVVIKFVDYKPVVKITWNVSVYCSMVQHTQGVVSILIISSVIMYVSMLASILVQILKATCLPNIVWVFKLQKVLVDVRYQREIILLHVHIAYCTTSFYCSYLYC